MTSDDIESLGRDSFITIDHLHARMIQEIAYQLAVMNERNAVEEVKPLTPEE